MLTQLDKARRLARRLGGARGGEFSPAGIPISRLTSEYGTPLYLYHGELVVQRVRELHTALGSDVEVFYSLKANPSLGLCQIVVGEGCNAEVASAGELLLARAAGFPAGDIVFAGPGKTDEELRLAVREGIFAVNVESLNEIDRLAAFAEEHGSQAGVGLRVNPVSQLVGSQMRMGGGASQFGIDEADLDEAVRRVLAYRKLVLRGVHVYTATQVFDADALLRHCSTVLEIGLRVASRAGQSLEMVDFGGGFGIPYFENMQDFDLNRFGRGLQQALSDYRADSRLEGCRFILELGRYMVAEAGLYVTRVVDVKRSQGTTFVVTDGGMNHHIIGTGNFGQVFRKPFPLLNLTRMEDEPEGGVTVAGPCCTPLDVFGANIPLATVEVGDLIGVFYSGAYGLSASSLRFLSHPTPAEVLLWKGTSHLLRQAGKAHDVLEGQQALVQEALGTPNEGR